MADKVVGVSWAPTAFPLRYQVDSRLVATLPAGTLDRALAMWSGIPEAEITFQGVTAAGSVKAGYDQVNTISLADGLMENQKALALTSNWYDKNGVLTEADIQIDASLSSTKYNVQQALAHEIGHVLGLDHSAVLSSVMFPYLTRTTDVPQLDSDDRIGIAAIYPKMDPTLTRGTLQGRVTSNSGGIFAAQVVAVNEIGEPVATALSDATGEFMLTGLPPGDYRVYAEPLDGPVDARNLAGIYREASAAFFPTQFFNGVVHIESGKKVGNIIVSSDGAPPELNPKWIGVGNEGEDMFNLSSTSRIVKVGETVSLAVAGDGIVSGMTEFEVLNPGFARTSDFRYAANYVYANYKIASDAPAGSAVIVVKSGNQTAALTGALRIFGPASRNRATRR
jgi:hypothetical protein